jgi:predicted nucleotidyltransferase component of viral defense system
MSKDLERSLKDRIKAIAKAQNRAFNDVWKALALERFLARLARSDKLDRFIFKGGFLLAKYLRLGRETTDLDFSLTETEGKVEVIRALINEILSLSYDDGFAFEGLEVQEMNHSHMNYPGYEVRTTACLGQTRTKIRMDIGIGDRVLPVKKSFSLLSLNNKPLFESEVSIQAYPLPYIFAEKLEAVVYRGGTNSRMKDFCLYPVNPPQAEV